MAVCEVVPVAAIYRGTTAVSARLFPPYVGKLPFFFVVFMLGGVGVAFCGACSCVNSDERRRRKFSPEVIIVIVGVVCVLCGL